MSGVLAQMLSVTLIPIAGNMKIQVRARNVTIEKDLTNSSFVSYCYWQTTYDIPTTLSQ